MVDVREEALMHMGKALDLIDLGGPSIAACYIQFAIDNLRSNGSIVKTDATSDNICSSIDYDLTDDDPPLDFIPVAKPS